MLTDEASTTEDGKLFQAQTTLAEKPLTQLKLTSLNLYFESVIAQIMSTTMIQLNKVLHVYLVNSPHYTIHLNQISSQLLRSFSLARLAVLFC